MCSLRVTVFPFPRSGTIAAAAALLLLRVFRDADYPIGGSGAIVDALVRGLEKNGGTLRLGTHVEQVSKVYLSVGVAARCRDLELVRVRNFSVLR